MPFENNFVYKIYSFTLARKTMSFPASWKVIGTAQHCERSFPTMLGSFMEEIFGEKNSPHSSLITMSWFASPLYAVGLHATCTGLSSLGDPGNISSSRGIREVKL